MLEAQLPNLEGLNPAIASEYVKGADGTFTLGVNPVNGFSLEDVAGLKTALGAERSNAKAANAKLEIFGDLDAGKAREALAKVAGMATWTPEEKVKEQMAAHAKQLSDKHGIESGKMQETITGMTKHLSKRVIKGDARAAIVKEGGNPDLLEAIVTKQLQMAVVDGEYVAQVIDEKGVVRVSMIPGSTDAMSITELVAGLKSSETYAPAFAGSGATGSGGGNSGAGGASGNVDTISRKDAQDTPKYRAARDRANKAGRRLVIAD